MESATDTLSPSERSERMGRIRGRDTKPELVVRRMVFAMGYRYRLHERALPGRPDLVFPGRKRALFVHGCFWHRHAARCKLARLPKSRLEFWLPKLEGNRTRDRSNEAKLRARGWRVLVVWECQLRNRERLKGRLVRFMEGG
jgi:DNA mismatch endonuclease (patch repair protein)